VRHALPPFRLLKYHVILTVPSVPIPIRRRRRGTRFNASHAAFSTGEGALPSCAASPPLTAAVIFSELLFEGLYPAVKKCANHFPLDLDTVNVYFYPQINRALRLKAAETERSISDFNERAGEPKLLFEDVLMDLKKRGKI
jgi:hypothetical protein